MAKGGVRTSAVKAQSVVNPIMKLIQTAFAWTLALVPPAAAALTNVAPSGTASASSEGYGAIAADGNDNNRDGTFGAGSVFHTLNETGPSWWQVVLPGARYLDHVRLFNRVDAVQGSVGNFRITATKAGAQVFNRTFLPAIAADSNNSRAWGTSALRGVQADTSGSRTPRRR